MQDWLEWQSFGLALLSTWVYGKSKKYGACVGIVCAMSFFAFGYVASLPAAMLCNVAFFAFHCRNLRIAYREDHGWPL